MRAQPNAVALPFMHQWSSSRMRWKGQFANYLPGEVWTRHARFTGNETCLLPGDHWCGPEEYWTNGWPAGTPPLATSPEGYVICCGGPVSLGRAFTTGFDLGFDA